MTTWRLGARSALTMLAMLVCVSLARARPLVRNVKTDDEFRKLLKHHAEVLIPRAHAPHSLECHPHMHVS
jgi:hypothetical protein